MAHDHAHSRQVEGNERRLSIALGLTTIFMLVEVVGAVMTNSLALLSDAAHMFTDVAALAISLAAVKVGKRAPDDRRSYGYQRFEILAAAFNAILLFMVAGYILYEAVGRFMTPPEVESTGMFWIAVVGLVVNVISMRLLSGGKDESLNVKGAYLEVWSDMLGSAGVIVAAILIGLTGWLWLDPLVAVGIGLWVLPRTWTLLKASSHILLEGTPTEVDVTKLRAVIEGHPGVARIHDLHVWALTSDRNILTAHVVCAGSPSEDLLLTISERVKAEFRIFHTTIQLEADACGEMDVIAPNESDHTDGHGPTH